jgi:hypothetical protein
MAKPVTDDLLRDALRAYIMTVPSLERLHAFLDAADLRGHEAVIRKRLDAVVAEVERFMYAMPKGALYDAKQAELLFAHLCARHTFLDDASARGLSGFAMWYAWHEGFLPR